MAPQSYHVFQHRCLTGEKEYNRFFAQFDKNTPVLSTATIPTLYAHTMGLSVQGYKALQVLRSVNSGRLLALMEYLGKS